MQNGGNSRYLRLWSGPHLLPGVGNNVIAAAITLVVTLGTTMSEEPHKTVRAHEIFSVTFLIMDDEYFPSLIRGQIFINPLSAGLVHRDGTQSWLLKCFFFFFFHAHTKLSKSLFFLISKLFQFSPIKQRENEKFLLSSISFLTMVGNTVWFSPAKEEMTKYYNNQVLQ